MNLITPPGSELIAHIEWAHVTDGTLVFKLAEITDLYHSGIKVMGFIVPQIVHD